MANSSCHFTIKSHRRKFLRSVWDVTWPVDLVHLSNYGRSYSPKLSYGKLNSIPSGWKRQSVTEAWRGSMYWSVIRGIHNSIGWVDIQVSRRKLWHCDWWRRSSTMSDLDNLSKNMAKTSARGSLLHQGFAGVKAHPLQLWFKRAVQERDQCCGWIAWYDWCHVAQENGQIQFEIHILSGLGLGACVIGKKD